MAVPYLAEARAHFIYQVASLTHTMNIPCNISVTGGVYTIDANAGGAIGVQAAADAVGGDLAPLFSDDDFGGMTMELQEKVGLSWVTRDTVTPAGTASASVVTVQASQLTLVLRDISNHLAKIILLETVATLPYHYTSVGALAGNLLDFYKLFSVTSGTVANRPAYWMVSRGDNALMDQPLVGVTGDLNDKVRRARGLV